MNKSVPMLFFLGVAALILAACSASPDQSNPEQVKSGNLPGNEGLGRSTEDGQNDIGNAEDVFSPTMSPLFEQDYGPNETSDRDYSDLEIITLLPLDGIPALTFPNYYSVEAANQEYMPEELVIGVELNGDARAYSISLLSRHEIVNDTVGGIHLAVTW